MPLKGAISTIHSGGRKKKYMRNKRRIYDNSFRKSKADCHCQEEEQRNCHYFIFKYSINISNVPHTYLFQNIGYTLYY